MTKGHGGKGVRWSDKRDSKNPVGPGTVNEGKGERDNYERMQAL